MKSLIRKRNIIIAIVAVVLVGIAAVAASGAGTMTVELDQVSRGPVRDIIEEEAQVMSRESRNISVLVSGTILENKIEVGDYVEAGTVLAVLDTSDVENEIDIAEEQFNALKFAFQNALEPADRELVKQYEAAYEAKVIVRDSAKSTLDKNKKLFEMGAVSEQAFMDSQTAYALAQEDVNASRQALLQLQKGLSETMKSKLASEVNAQDGVLEMLFLKKDRHEVKATVSGIVLSRFYEAGDYVTTGSVMFEVADTKDIYFKSDILDSDVGLVKVGTEAIIHLNEETTVQGKVTKVFPKAETRISDLGIEQKRVTVEIDVHDAVDGLLIGQELDVDYIADSREDVLRVREELTYQRSGEYYVFVIENGRAQERAVEAGLVGDVYVEIRSGLGETDKIIVPQDELEPGVKVKLIEN